MAHQYGEAQMKQLPFSDPGQPDTRSPTRFLVWIGRQQLGTLALGMAYGVVWMLSQALLPYALGRAVDDGLAAGDNGALLKWAAVLLGLGTVQAFAGVSRHRAAVSNWLQAAFRMVQVVSHHAARLGPAVRANLTTGEVVATVSNDAMRAGGAYDITARLAGAIASYFVVAAILLSTSFVLGLVVLLGVPVLVMSLSFVIRPLQARQREQREEVGRLTALGADTVSGLRVLRGIGGEQVFLARYRSRSEQVRRAGVRVALPQSTLDSAQVLLPGIFVVIVTWLGARLAVDGRIRPGELVAFYGYAAFLVIPLRTAAETVDKVTRAYVGANRMLAILRIQPQVTDPEAPVPEPPPGLPLTDRRSGLVVEPGLFTCVVSAVPQEGVELVDRLGRFVHDDGVLLGGVPVGGLPIEVVRRRIVVSETDPMLFSGPLQEELDPWGRASETEVLAAIAVANAEDVLDALPERLAGLVEERGRSLSGGQRQRLVLARALLADAEILLLVDPTSAVDAHTEARIARRLREARRGRTTVVLTASPLVLDQADRVVFLEDRVVEAIGTHRELLRSAPAYRATVTREEAE
jgi:ABC-type multidrug transport system fused ATPase/permease subunit